MTMHHNARYLREGGKRVAGVLLCLSIGAGPVAADVAVPAAKDIVDPVKKAMPVDAGRSKLVLQSKDRATILQPVRRRAVKAKNDLPEDPYVLNPGEKVRIRFSNREDISGEFTIRANGYIALPDLGGIQASGIKVNELETRIKDLFRKKVGRETQLHVEVIQRRPVFVVGDVKQPGSFPFMTGMTVLQSMAIAGGLYRLAARASGDTQFLRSKAAVIKTELALKNALARLSRLNAEQKSLADIVPDQRLISLAGKTEISTLLNEQRRIMGDNQRYNELRLRNMNSTIQLASAEHRALQDALKHTKTQKHKLQIEYKNTNRLLKRGLTKRTKVFQYQQALSTVSADVERRGASVIRAAKFLAESKSGLLIYEANIRRNRNRDLVRATSEIAALSKDLTASQQMIISLTGRKLSSGGNNTTMAKSIVAYQILRKIGQKATYIDVGETSNVLPGDVVRVILDRSGQSTASN